MRVFERVAKFAIHDDLVVVPSSDPGAVDVPLGDQVGDDRLGGPFGDPHLCGDVTPPHGGIRCDAHQDVRVVGEERPTRSGGRAVRCVHAIKRSRVREVRYSSPTKISVFHLLYSKSCVTKHEVEIIR